MRWWRRCLGVQGNLTSCLDSHQDVHVICGLVYTITYAQYGMIVTFACLCCIAFFAFFDQQFIHSDLMAPNTKRGLCWPNDNKDPVFPFTKPGSKVSWLYNWSPNQTPNASSIDFVPMQWNHVNIEELQGTVKAMNSSAVLGFNEPELPDQSNIPVELAAQKWLQYIEPMRKAGIRCGSPGISSAPQGVVWLKDFLSRIRAGGSDVDFYAFHWYGVEIGQFYDYIWSTYYQMPDQTKKVWITE